MTATRTPNGATDGATDGAESPHDRLAGAVEVLSKVVAPTTLATALLVYFGWSRTSTTYGSFGIDWAVLDFSIQDYLLRSISGTFTPAAALLLALLVALPAHTLLGHLLARHRARTGRVLVARVVAGTIAGLGAVLTVLGVLGFSDVLVFRTSWPLVPSMLGAGVLLLWYSPHLYGAATHQALPFVGSRTPVHDAWRIMLGLFVVLTLFWAVAVYGRAVGYEEAVRIAQEPRALTGVVVYSAQSLRLDGVGVTETPLPVVETRYKFRYDGLRMLVRSRDQVVLLPAAWRPGSRAVVLADDPDVRVEFYLGVRPPN